MGKAYRSFRVSELKIFTMTSEYLAAAPRPRLGETELGRRERGLRPPQKGPRPAQPHQPTSNDFHTLQPSPPTDILERLKIVADSPKFGCGNGLVWLPEAIRMKIKIRRAHELLQRLAN